MASRYEYPNWLKRQIEQVCDELLAHGGRDAMRGVVEIRKGVTHNSPILYARVNAAVSNAGLDLGSIEDSDERNSVAVLIGHTLNSLQDIANGGSPSPLGGVYDPDASAMKNRVVRMDDERWGYLQSQPGGAAAYLRALTDADMTAKSQK